MPESQHPSSSHTIEGNIPTEPPKREYAEVPNRVLLNTLETAVGEGQTPGQREVALKIVQELKLREREEQMVAEGKTTSTRTHIQNLISEAEELGLSTAELQAQLATIDKRPHLDSKLEPLRGLVDRSISTLTLCGLKNANTLATGVKPPAITAELIAQMPNTPTEKMARDALALAVALGNKREEERIRESLKILRETQAIYGPKSFAYRGLALIERMSLRLILFDIRMQRWGKVANSRVSEVIDQMSTNIGAERTPVAV